MNREIDLMKNYPKSKRNVEERGFTKTEAHREVARRFDQEFFDGDRSVGYGGFSYHPRFWTPTLPDFIKHYDLTGNSSVLDVGCAKGFMLYDLIQLVPKIHARGIDISHYAIENAKEEVKGLVSQANATKLPFHDASFDLVISINTIHNLEGEDLKSALREISRVSRKYAFITVDAYRTEEEKARMYQWNLTAKTILHVEEWKELFDECGYAGDYYWFIP